LFQKYEKTFARVKQSLAEFSQQFPHPDNPANTYVDLAAQQAVKEAEQREKELEASLAPKAEGEASSSLPGISIFFSWFVRCKFSTVAVDADTDKEKMLLNRYKELEKIAKGLYVKLETVIQNIFIPTELPLIRACELMLPGAREYWKEEQGHPEIQGCFETGTVEGSGIDTADPTAVPTKPQKSQ
jgi:hypothetical protein